VLAFLSELVRPTRRARAVPLGRLAIATVFAFAAVFLAFTLRSTGVRLPFLSHPYVVHAEFLDAAGLDAGNGPQVSVAGVPEGEVTAVRYQDGRARVTMDLSPSARGRVFADASVRVRPFNAANFLQVDIDPGHPSAGPLRAGATIDVSHTSVPVNTDQVLDVLDADTRGYLQILTEQAAVGLDGRGGQLADALARLDPLSRETAQIGDLLDARRTLIAQVVGQSNAIFGTLARRHSELATVIGAGTRALAVTARRAGQIAPAMRELPGVLAQGTATSAALTRTAPVLERALTGLAPAARAFTSGLHAVHGALPALQRIRLATASLTDQTLKPSADLATLTRELGTSVDPAIADYESLDDVIHTVGTHRQQIIQFSDALAGLLSTQDSYGVLGRVKIGGIEPLRPQDLGLSAASARSTGTAPSPMDAMVVQALTALCRRNQPLACVIAAATPGLPGSAVPRSAGLIPVRAGRGSTP
jgi:virulence factor Mce-like protein